MCDCCVTVLWLFCAFRRNFVAFHRISHFAKKRKVVPVCNSVPLKKRMWVNRISAKGGFHYEVYVNDASTRVTRMGTIYLYNIGWHPSCSPFVSSDDDAILRKRRLLLFDEDKWNSHCLRPGSWRSFWPRSGASGRVPVQPVRTTSRTIRALVVAFQKIWKSNIWWKSEIWFN